MQTIYTSDPEIVKLALSAFPGYNGKKFKVTAHSGSMRLDSYWSGGSRSYYVAMDLATRKQVVIPENGTPWSNGGKILQADEIPVGVAIIEHCISCGKDLGITIFVHPDNLDKFALPAPVELTLGQRIVLIFTSSRKSSYNGRNRAEMALDDTGMPVSEWDKAKAELIARGLLKANGAITDEGRNAIGSASTYGLKWVAEDSCDIVTV